MICTVGTSDPYLKQCCENKDYRFFCTVIETVAQLKQILFLKILGILMITVYGEHSSLAYLKKLIKLQKSASNELILIGRRMTILKWKTEFIA